MKNVCVITGGGSGMGLATAKILGKDHHVIISGRSVAKLEGAIAELKALDIEATAVACDVADLASVLQLAETARAIGPVITVIHAAGISPNMGDPDSIIRINAVGTIHIHNVFINVIEKGGCLIDVSSMGAYVVPAIIKPTRAYRLCHSNINRFVRKLKWRSFFVPPAMHSGLAYGIAKDFVIWLARTDAVRFGKKGLRVLSVSPGAFETDMGEIEREGAEDFVQYCAIKRFGHVEEVAQLMAYCADPKLGYLTGTDILCDGGCMAGYRQSWMSMIGLTKPLEK